LRLVIESILEKFLILSHIATINRQAHSVNIQGKVETFGR